ncbi:MAG: hypothetical protein AAF518_12135 [Spirochaetota bacterium]
MQAYKTIDEQLHLLCQPLAKVNEGFVSPAADQSHTNLSFDPVSGRIYARWIENGTGKQILALNTNEQKFEWLDENFQVKEKVAAANKSIVEIEQAIQQSLTKVGLSPDKFPKGMSYEIPDYSFAGQAIAKLDSQACANWQKYRNLANLACQQTLTYLQAVEQVRIWPHHFDTGIYVEANQHIGVGFGFAMADSMIDAPYFYVAAYPLKDKSFGQNTLPNLSDGEWKVSESWHGAVLSAEKLPVDELENNLDKVAIFVKECVDSFFLLRE